MLSESSGAKAQDDLVHRANDVETADLVKPLDAAELGDEGNAEDIKSTDEITGLRLALIIVALCFSNVLTGLVS